MHRFSVHDRVVHQDIILGATDENVYNYKAIKPDHVGQACEDLKAMALADSHQLDVLHNDLLDHVDARDA